jgi:hypothetical protein
MDWKTIGTFNTYEEAFEKKADGTKIRRRTKNGKEVFLLKMGEPIKQEVKEVQETPAQESAQ